MKDLLRTSDLTPADFERLLDLAAAFKAKPYLHPERLRNETVVLYFNKPSTRTRISFETAVARLGGVPVSVGANDLQLGRGETVEDTAHVISRFAKAFVIRTFKDADVATFARTATVPVVNALTDGHHPCQSVADLMTLREERGDLKGRKLAYVGDGNNVVHSLLEACALTGTHIAVGTPPGYEPDPLIVEEARAIAQHSGAEILITNDPNEAAAGADALYADVWLSMGDAPETREKRFNDLEPYRIDSALMERAQPDAIFLHCLPQHRGEEVTAEVTDGPRSRIFDQAENRLHTAVAILHALLERSLEGAARRT